MNQASKLKLAVCSSASFYTEVITLSYQLEGLGLQTVLPKTARKMREECHETDS